MIDSVDEADLSSDTAGQWDGFVAATPGGDLVQTTAWAESKRAIGFETLPVTTRSGAALIGGAQIVVKRFGSLGALAYVARGPLLAPGQGDRLGSPAGASSTLTISGPSSASMRVTPAPARYWPRSSTR